MPNPELSSLKLEKATIGELISSITYLLDQELQAKDEGQKPNQEKVRQALEIFKHLNLRIKRTLDQNAEEYDMEDPDAKQAFIVWRQKYLTNQRIAMAGIIGQFMAIGVELGVVSIDPDDHPSNTPVITHHENNANNSLTQADITHAANQAKLETANAFSAALLETFRKAGFDIASDLPQAAGAEEDATVVLQTVAKRLQELSAQKEDSSTLKRQLAETNSRNADLNREKHELEDRLAKKQEEEAAKEIAQARLNTKYQNELRRADLAQHEIDALKLQIEALITQIGTSPQKSEPKTKEQIIGIEPQAKRRSPQAEEFRRYCDTAFAGMKEKLGAQNTQLLSGQGRIETQTTFLKRGSSDYNPRYGLYYLMNAQFGSSVSAVGNVEEIGQLELGKLNDKDRSEVRDVILLLEKDNVGSRLTKMLAGGMIGGRTYWNYSYRKTEPFFLPRLPELTKDSHNFSKDEFYFDVPKFMRSIKDMIDLLRETNTKGKSKVLSEVVELLETIQQSAFLRDLQNLVKDYPEAYAEGTENDLEKRQAGTTKASDRLLGLINRHIDTLNLLQKACSRLAVFLPLSSYHAKLKETSQPKNEKVDIDTDGTLVVENARNPHAVLLSSALGGRYLGNEDSEWYRWYTIENQPLWPYSETFSEHITQAVQEEVPISISIDPSKPVILLTGNNGSGKTRAMETVGQTVAHALLTGTNCAASIIRMPPLREIRSLIGASKHSQALSSYQRESTLVADAMATLINKSPEEKAILIVDEVGKGTDSRDAIALMTAVAEYCIRNNIYLLMATHHGKEFVSLAEQIGIRDFMQILSPEYGTHQLRQYEQPVSSKGVEVMEERARKRKIPSGVLTNIIGNARLARECVLTNSAPLINELDAIDIGIEAPLAFADQETLSDIGLSWTKRSYDAEDTVQFEPLLQLAMTSGKIGGGSAYSMGEAGVLWNESFLEAYKASTDKDTKDTNEEHQIFDSWVSFFRKLPLKEQSSLLEAISNSVTTVRGLLSGTESTEFDKQRTAYTKYISGNLNAYVGIESSQLKQIADFMTKYGSHEAADRHFDYLLKFGNALLNSGDNRLVTMGNQILNLQYLRGDLKAAITENDRASAECFSNHMRKLTAKTIRDRVSGYSYKLSDTDATELAQLLGESPQSAKEFFENVASRIEGGDQRVYKTFCQWIYDSQKGNRDYVQTAKSYLYKETGLEAVVEVTNTIKASPNKTAQYYKFPAGLTDHGSWLLDKYLNGDISEFAKVTTAAQRAEVWFDYSTHNKVLDIIQNASLNLYFTWKEQISKQMSKSEKRDLYSCLDLKPGATADEIKASYRSIARRNHPDVVTPVLYRGKDIKEAPPEVQAEVSRAREKYEAASHANQILSDSVEKARYDSSAGTAAINSAPYYSTIANAIVNLNWCRAEESTDGSFALKNSLAVGLLSKLGPEQIVRQSIEIDGQTDAVVIGGSNGNGKSQLLIQLASNLEWSKVTGYCPAEFARIPKADFIYCMINAGESTEGKSSFQSEIDRYLQLIEKYIKAGCPKNGYIFLDEPLAGTSSEDQIGILLAVINFFKQRGVKVVFTNHNYKTYEYMRKTKSNKGNKIKFKPVAYLSGAGRYTLAEYGVDNTDAIRSDGIKVAGEMGLPEEMLKVAYYARNVLTGTTSI